MPETPRRVRDKVDTTIDALNARWDLRLPHLHGPEAWTAENQQSLGKKCSAKIRYLCFRPVNLERITADFEVKARQLFTHWVFKPSQERGTIPTWPVKKSQVEHDLRSKSKSGVVSLTETQRQQLHEVLHSILDEDYQLARETDAYERKDGPSSVSASSSSTNSSYHTPAQSPTTNRRSKHITKVVKPDADEPEMKDPLGKSAKRSFNSPPKNAKRQQTMIEYLKARPAVHSSGCEEQKPPGSFETVQSGAAPSVFSSANRSHTDTGSADTSLCEPDLPKSQDLICTQATDEYNFIEQMERSITESIGPTLPVGEARLVESQRPIDKLSPSDITYFDKNSPFKPRPRLANEMPYWQCWDIHRIADELDMDPNDLIEMVVRIMASSKNKNKGDSFWEAIKSIFARLKKQIVPKSEFHKWMVSSSQYYDETSNTATSFKGKFEWCKDTSKGLFDFKLSPLQSDKSYRFQRHFGADRFLIVSSPVLSQCPLLKKETPATKEIVHENICEWLVKTPHYIAGRYWRVFYAEQDKAKKRPKDQNETPRIKLFLFAESGVGIEPIMLTDLHSLQPSLGTRHHQEIKVEDLLEWHMPMSHNIRSTDLKLFSRLSLGFSRTTPTVVLRRDQFIYVSDTLGTTGTDGSRKVMNDGCARMSLALAQAIWKKCGDTYGYDVPSVVQGRISGAKGLWLVDYENTYADQGYENNYWIEVNDSQLKIQPHPALRHDADESQRTFEVLKHSGLPTEGHLNLQLITVLEDRGVLPAVFQDALVADTSAYSGSLMAAMLSPTTLALWLQEYASIAKAEITNMLGRFPSEKADQVILLLDVGVEPADSAMIADAIYKILSNHMEEYVERLKIKVPNSTVVFCAPDPLGVLQPGEVHMGFTKSINDPRTGVPENNLDNIQVLLARNSAYLPSDIQQVTAVYKRTLRNYKDVILFSTRGEIPLASLLSGGDYDGDTVTVIWDPKIIERFHNVDKIPQLKSEIECGLVNRSRPLSTIFGDHPTQPNSGDWQTCLKGCIMFNSRPSLMGMCSSEYEKLVYSLSVAGDQSKLSHGGVLGLAALAGYLVDATKKGWELTDKGWIQFKRGASGRLALPVPAYKSDTLPAICANVIDFLKFKVAKGQMGNAKKAFVETYSKKAKYDPDIGAFWKHYMAKALAEGSLVSGTRSRNALPEPASLTSLILHGENSLSNKIKQIVQDWKDGHRGNNNNNSFHPESHGEGRNFVLAINDINHQFQSIAPPPMSHHWIRDQHEDGLMSNLSIWSLLRASCLYYEVCCGKGHSSWIWYVAGPELCLLKALKCGLDSRVVLDRMHRMMKVDTKHARRLLEKQEESFANFEEEDENDGD
ncbi:hypothetical protein LTR84_010779 [Exophiala bonariae]|uniref:RNA-dependent RNA polymerase n=1 Tax=Exophiala bonariae TaxID=1690606 RepID=A0AAV9NJS7_9EURO|nr:hypothetical protein LTR84_010779 [Exophiala bonariae]